MRRHIEKRGLCHLRPSTGAASRVKVQQGKGRGSPIPRPVVVTEYGDASTTVAGGAFCAIGGCGSDTRGDLKTKETSEREGWCEKRPVGSRLSRPTRQQDAVAPSYWGSHYDYYCIFGDSRCRKPSKRPPDRGFVRHQRFAFFAFFFLAFAFLGAFFGDFLADFLAFLPTLFFGASFWSAKRGFAGRTANQSRHYLCVPTKMGQMVDV
jgi:hypothetical protein